MQGFGQLFTFAMTDVQVANCKSLCYAPHYVPISYLLSTMSSLACLTSLSAPIIHIHATSLFKVVTETSGFRRVGAMIGSWRQSVYQV
jgi:hypothetical protein